MTRVLLLLSVAAVAAWGQKYNGPMPEKEDLPYIVQADNLVPTEAGTAQEQKGKKKDETLYTIAGAGSSAKTPLASPIFIVKVKDLVPEKLGLYRLEVRNGRREITIQTGKHAKVQETLRVDVKKIGDDLYRIEVGVSLPNGEYSLSPQGSNDVYCFAVF
jgi:hypothetical protein